jgi:16S rRNA (guanine527-N7)-methyltransferase
MSEELMDTASPVPSAPAEAVSFFGDRLPAAEAFVAVLADTGVSHGLIGPREVPRLWDRHVLNCSVIEDAFPEGARVIDVGSGAGLPGLALAIARPDLELHLVEPMQRRTDWLGVAVETIGLTNVTVHRGRAEEFHGTLRAPFVTARAVAPLDRLARWTFPLLEPGGRLVAMKGSSVRDELATHERVLRKLGMQEAEVVEHGLGVVEPATITVQLTVVPRAASSVKVRKKRR